MNIGVDIRALDTAYTTGVDSYLRQLLQNWLQDNRGHKFLLFGTPRLTQNSLAQDFISRGHKFIAQPWPNKVFNASLMFRGKPHLDVLLGKPDVVFLPNTMFHAFSPAAKTVITFHDLSFERLKSIYSFKRNLWHKAVNPQAEALLAKKVIAVSHSTASDLRQVYGLNENKISVIPLGVDFDKFHHKRDHRLSLPDDYILFLGNVEPRKNVLALVEAFKIKSNRYPDLHLVIAGTSFPQADTKVLSHITGRKKIIFKGFVSEDEKVELYQRAKMTVLPSLYEGFGLPILESFAAGTPVITSVNSAMPEVSAGAALLVNPLNTSELASGMDTLLTSELIRNRLISRGLEAAKAMTWSKTAGMTLDILESVNS